MKRLLTTALLFFSLVSLASDQYSQRYCDDLKAEREYIRKRFNTGYGITEGNFLNERDREIYMLMAKHCRKPVPDASYYYTDVPVRRTSPVITSNTRRLPRANFSAHNHVFTPEKSAAWDAFYKIPARCRSKDMTQDDFVFCAENKSDQRREFEQQWSNQTP